MSGEPFTTSRPASTDIPGATCLYRNVTTNGLSELRGRSCQLELAPDGTFTIAIIFPVLFQRRVTGVAKPLALLMAGHVGHPV